MELAKCKRIEKLGQSGNFLQHELLIMKKVLGRSLNSRQRASFCASGILSESLAFVAFLNQQLWVKSKDGSDGSGAKYHYLNRKTFI